MLRVPLPLAFALGVLGASAARAVDGVIEINQLRAEAGGVSPGDTPGFPVTLAAGASYRLTSDLVTLDDDIPLIDDAPPIISSGTIQLDLNGFSLFCRFLVVTCGDGAGSGIHFDDVSNVTIRNGSVSGMGSYGVLVSTPGARIEDVHVINNGASLNLAGVRCGEGCLISRSVARSNQIGFFTDGGSTVIDSVAATNEQAGIRVGAGSLVRGCSVFSNATQGVIAGNGAAILSNAIYSNGGLGIDAIVGAEFGYGQNTLNQNNGGGANPQVDASSTNLGGNMCQGDATCP